MNNLGLITKGIFMKADTAWMLSDFIGTKKVQFQIPVYQRNYDWSESNCNRLLDDIKNIIDTGQKHFVGTIVFMSAEDTGFSLKRYTVIDGQQRLTTMMLILKALCNLSEDKDQECYDEIMDDYLHNQHCDEEFKVKLKPIKGDNDQFLALLQNRAEEINKEGHIWLNYQQCKQRMEDWVKSGISYHKILTALEKLQIVYIELTKGQDDPQIIFESINSTGLDLTNADLIRNFLLMDAEKQEELFEIYWQKIEKLLKPGTDYSNMNQFFVNYLVYKTGSPVTEERLYENFVKLFKANKFTSESCLKELTHYAEIFQALVYDTAKYSTKIREDLENLRTLKQTTLYPFLLHVFDDYHQKVIDEVALEQIVGLLFKYLLRRMVCGVPSNSLRGFFTYLYSRVFKVKENKQKYYSAINKFIYTRTNKDAMPTDNEFRNALMHNNLYRNLPLCKFLLVAVENGAGKETLNVANLTIEHIMPQKLNMDWKHITQEQHEEYVNVLGNLSLTGINSEMSNKSFEDKKALLKEYSKAINLNKDVWDEDLWDIERIEKRTARLADNIVSKYQIERITDDAINFEYITVLGVQDADKVTGRKLVSYTFRGEVNLQDTYILMLQEILRILMKENPEIINGLLADNHSSPRFSKESNLLNRGMKINDDVFFEGNISSKSVIRAIAAMLQAYNIAETEFSFAIVAENSRKEC